MFLLRLQVHQLQKLMVENNFNLLEFTSDNTSTEYSIKHKNTDCYFQIQSHNSGSYRFVARVCPDLSSPNQPKKIGSFALKNWEETVQVFNRWIPWAKEELEAPDLFAEVAHLFTTINEPTDDKFTRTELAEVQGQLRLLQQSFTASALPEAAKQKLIELTQTAAVKAEGFTKKDWQGWFIGSLISVITALALNPTQANDVYKLVKAVFGGLFLH